MPFTKSPTIDTYSTERVSLYKEITDRSAYDDKDENYINVFFEPIKERALNDNRKWITKRPGNTSGLASVNSRIVRGVHYWQDLQRIYFASGTNIYYRDLVGNTTTTIASVFTNDIDTEVGFCEFLYDDGTVVLMVTDGFQLFRINSASTVTQVTDPDLPAPHRTSLVFLDGYLFLVDNNTADIYNSDLNDPTAWTPGNFITAEMDADYVLKICKLNNYLLAFGTHTIEYFWDAGVETGSPMQRNDTPVKINGYLGGFAQFGNQIYFVGNSEASIPSIFKLEDFKISEVASETVCKYLSSLTNTRVSWKGNIISTAGRTFYMLYAGTSTFIMDLRTQLWTRWARGTNTYFDMIYSVNVQQTSAFNCFFFLDQNSTTLYFFKENIYQDNLTNFTCTIITDTTDFGTMNRKTMSKLVVIGDRPDIDANLMVSWSDDDYKTFSTPRAINLNQDMPDIKQLGVFRQRIFKFELAANAPMRLDSIEVDINKGSK